MVHVDNALLFSAKKKQAIEPQKIFLNITERMKPMWKGYVLYDSNHDILEKEKLQRW